VFPESVAEMVTVVLLAEALVETAKVAVTLPEGTRTAEGTDATVLFELEIPTESPPDGAGPLSRIVAAEDEPAATVVGLRASDDSVTGGGGGDGLTVRAAVRVRPP
jgi:hypothetical protein